MILLKSGRKVVEFHGEEWSGQLWGSSLLEENILKGISEFGYSKV